MTHLADILAGMIINAADNWNSPQRMSSGRGKRGVDPGASTRSKTANAEEKWRHYRVGSVRGDLTFDPPEIINPASS